MLQNSNRLTAAAENLPSLLLLVVSLEYHQAQIAAVVDSVHDPCYWWC
jgi:hypothetical protein